MSFQEQLFDLATDKKTAGPIVALIKFFLYLLSLLYGFIVMAVIFFQGLKKTRLDCKVISVGNITLGGTGKTVMVQMIAAYLGSHGRKPAILSRGYKRPSPVRLNGQNSYETMGDEPFMIQGKLKNIPVLVDPDRISSGKKAVSQYGADTVILDDGFQQWRLVKDLEIVMLDGLKPFGNRRLLPRGILRQPLYTLKSADIFVLTNCREFDLKRTRESLLRINPGAMVLEAQHQAKGIFRLSRREELLGPGFLNGQSAALFCGLGNPEAFRELAGSIGLKEGGFFEFPDHYRYYEEDIEKIVGESGEDGIPFLLTTEKDAVRIPLAARKRFGENIFVLVVELKLKNEEERFYQRLLDLYPA